MAKNQLKNTLYIYNPHHEEEVTIDDVLEIDPLVSLSEKNIIVIKASSLNGLTRTSVERRFRKTYILREIIPKKLWPTWLRPRQSIRINLSVVYGQKRCLSQPSYRLNLVRKKKELPEASGRCYCSVPWRNLRLGHLVATPCNTTIKGYRVPSHTQADHEPWNGDTMVRLRESLLQGKHKYCARSCPNYSTDEPQGIEQDFEGDPLIKENINIANQQYLDGDVCLESKPTLLRIKMGTDCDNNCCFCATHVTKNSFAINGRKLQLVKEYFPYARRIYFTGGEPLLYSEDIQGIIASHPPQEGKVIKFMTNGILLKERINFLRDLPNLYLSIALSTPCPKTYKQLYRTDSFQKIVEGIELVKQKRCGLKTKLQIKTIVMRSTYRQIREFSRMAKDLGASSVVFKDLRWNKHQDIDSKEKLMPEDPARDEALAAVKEARDFLASHGVRVASPILDGCTDNTT